MSKRIAAYLRAGYPALYILSPEKGRVQAELFAIAKELKRLDGSSNARQLVLWDVLTGCETVGGSQGEQRQQIGEGTTDPIACLQWAAGQEKKVVVLKDFHHFLGSPEVQCAFQQACEKVKSKFTTLVILSAKQVIPVELEKLITVVEFDLPNAPLLGRILQAVNRNKKQMEQPQITSVTEAALGLTEAEAENAFALSLIQTGGFCPQFVMSEKAQAVRKSGILEFQRRLSRYEEPKFNEIPRYRKPFDDLGLRNGQHVRFTLFGKNCTGRVSAIRPASCNIVAENGGGSAQVAVLVPLDNVKEVL